MKQAQTRASLLLISLLQISCLINAEPATKSTTVIVTVSGQKVMMESETGKAIQNRLQEEQKKLAAPLQNDEKKIRDKEQKLIKAKEDLDRDAADFEKNSKTMTTEARSQKLESLQERAQKLDDDKRELDRMVQKLQAEARKVEAKMSEIYQKEMGKFEALVKETIKDLAQRNGWEIVIMEESVVYANPNVSKTKDVVIELDKRAKAANLAKKQALEAKDAKN